MKIGIPKEIHRGEKRVATTPEVAGRLQKLGYEVLIQKGAGAKANYSDEDFAAAGVEIVKDAKTLWAKSDIVAKVRPPEAKEVGLLKEGGNLISFIWPAQNEELMGQLAD
ncbi:MAG: NAD(P)(+) transhydrogenase (Re/Si-specific) subunit alpha, partial [Methylococcus sp.]